MTGTTVYAGRPPSADPNEVISEVQGKSFVREVCGRFARNRLGVLGGATICAFAALAILAPVVAPYDPCRVDFTKQFMAPSRTFLLGTDEFGRDVLSRIIFGSRISLSVAVVPTVMSMIIGVLLGLLAGYFGGKVGTVIMRLADMVRAFPSLLLAMVVMFTLGGTLLNIFIALSFVSWAPAARVVRALALSLRERDFVLAARAIGASRHRIMAVHILPNCLAPVLVLLTLNIPGAIITEASLSFLGVGAPPPTPSWGLMISFGKEFILSAPWVSVFPGIAISLLVLGFNFFGDALRDAMDPYLKR